MAGYVHSSDSVPRGVLERVFSQGNALRPLHSFLSAALPGSPALLYTGDDEAVYRHMIMGAVVGIPSGANPVPKELDARQTESHVSLVHGVVGEMVHSEQFKHNVLCQGLWQAKSAANVNGVDGMAGVECAWPNSALNIVRGRSWELLHQRIGSQMLRYLLREMAVFVLLPHDCYLQVCGPALGVLIKQGQQVSSNKKAVTRARIFYDERFVRKVGFGRGDTLGDPQQCQPRRKCARVLVGKIFGSLMPATSAKWRIPKFLRPAIPLVCQVLKRHHKLRYGFWLKLHCPLISLHRSPEDHGHSDSDLTLEDVMGPELKPYGELAAGYTPHRAVCKFVTSCVSRLVPGALWGCGENISLMRAMVDEFVRARRYEDPQVDKWSARWKTSPCTWLPRNAPAKCRQMVRLWCAWLMNEVVIPLIRNHFYVTESAMHRNAVFYYRKPLWKAIVQAEMGAAPLKDMFRSLAPDQAQELVDNPFHLPSARLRLQPKATGTRPIVNLSSRAAGGGDSANTLLRPAFETLRWELLHNGKAHLLGASLFYLNEAHARLLPFIMWANRNPTRLLYFVKVDVKRSFDSIIQSRLCSVLFDNVPVFTEPRYVMQRYMVHVPRVGGSGTTATTKYVVTPESQMQPLNVALQEHSGARNSVLVDRASHEVVERADVEAILRHHITHSLVRVGSDNTYCVQEEGIPQGSVLSSLLCSLYYGDMERRELADLLGEQSVLVRFIDDNLFVTTSLAVAREFLSRFSARFVRDYGVQLNPSKTLVNFSAGSAIPQAQRDPAYPTENPCIPWCGLLIDTCTFETFGDYSRYRGAYVNDTLTVSLTEHPGASLRRKIKQFVQPKCIPLLLDCRINRPHTVLLNVYQMFLLCAIKFHCHVRHLPHHNNARFLLDVVVDVVEYANTLIQARLRKIDGLGGRDIILPRDVRYLGRHAFRHVLGKKHAWYTEVIHALNAQLHDSYYQGVHAKVEQVVCQERTAFFCSGMLL